MNLKEVNEMGLYIRAQNLWLDPNTQLSQYKGLNLLVSGISGVPKI